MTALNMWLLACHLYLLLFVSVCFILTDPAMNAILTDFPSLNVCPGLADRAQSLNTASMPDVFHKVALDLAGVCLLS